MAKGEVMDDTGRRVDLQTAYRVGACIFYYRELENEKVIPYVEHVLYQDEHILVADKPHFLPVIPSGRFLHQTLLVRLQKDHNLEGGSICFLLPLNLTKLNMPIRSSRIPKHGICLKVVSEYQG